ncbi:unnamed protein product [Durusdinium trenchii]|uniref:Methyltransferase type 11 domain-containing protein n=1 Tax=Durusdinium trenchii TaxID=1381693 RepID=A0ABP0P9E8_9DINO
MEVFDSRPRGVVEFLAWDMNRGERGRPSYPPCALQLLDHLLPSGPLELLDLGAGTGKWTMELLKYLHTSTAEVVIHAVEPSDGFRQRLQQNLSTRGRAAAERPPNLRVEVCEGDAQSLQSFGAKRMDGVFVATAFHWFATPEVLESIYQVLKDAGWLYLIWNVPLYYDLPQDRAHYDLKEHEALFLTALKKEVVNIYHDQSTMEVKDYNYKAAGTRMTLANLAMRIGRSVVTRRHEAWDLASAPEPLQRAGPVPLEEWATVCSSYLSPVISVTAMGCGSPKPAQPSQADHIQRALDQAMRMHQDPQIQAQLAHAQQQTQQMLTNPQLQAQLAQAQQQMLADPQAEKEQFPVLVTDILDMSPSATSGEQ